MTTEKPGRRISRPFRRVMIGLLLLGVLILLNNLLPNSLGSSITKKGGFIGVYYNSNDGEQAALRSIAQDIKRFPNAKVYTIRWSDCFIDIFDVEEQYHLEYDRSTHYLETGNWNGDNWWNGVTEQMIRESIASQDLNKTLTQHGLCEYP